MGHEDGARSHACAGVKLCVRRSRTPRSAPEYSGGQGQIRRSRAACVILAAGCLWAVPAWPQATCQYPSAVSIPPQGSCSDFLHCFNSPTYETQLPVDSNAPKQAGDWNATYLELFYSIYNLQSWMASGVNTGNGLPYCPVELVMVGTFPNSRYFSITVNDMHYAPAGHVADFAAPPGSTQPYEPGQLYAVPVSFGYVPQKQAPGTGAACTIANSEYGKLLDATQRHVSMDWNSVAQGSMGRNVPEAAHVVDLPEHTMPASQEQDGSNTAGSVIIRSYLPPPFGPCTGAPNAGLNCPPPPCPEKKCTAANGVTNQYFIVRDAYTGCAYTSSYVQQNMLSGTFALSGGGTGTGGQTAATAILATSDPSSGPSAALWLDRIMQLQHFADADIIPQACYANGGPNPSFGQELESGPPYFHNRVAWVRSPEFLGSEGPDDSYIGGAVSPADLQSLLLTNGDAPCLDSDNYPSTDGCVIRMRFQLPTIQSPDLPPQPCIAPYNCSVSPNAQMRYMSLTFWYELGLGTSGEPANGNEKNPVSLVSLADIGFAVTEDGDGSQYATLLVNVGGTLPDWLQQTASSTGVPQGVEPVQPRGASPKTSLPVYSVWTVNGYTVLDLSQFANAGFSTNDPLLITLRNTTPNSTFACSAQAVPYSTAEYTNVDGTGGGLMGPYVPLVDYVDPSNGNLVPQTGAPIPVLPHAGSCGALSNKDGPIFPALNNPSIKANLNGNGPLSWPEQYWPGWSEHIAQLLVCGSREAEKSNQIYYAATPRITEAVGQGCNAVPNNCSQIIPESPLEIWGLPGHFLRQPPIPITIVGTGFGYLPNLPQTVTSCQNSGACPNYIRVQNLGGSGLDTGWDTSEGAPCETYIANWSDTSISLVTNLPQTNSSPGFGATAQNTAGCPVMYDTVHGLADILQFTVTNPQSHVVMTLPPVAVQPYSATPN